MTQGDFRMNEMLIANFPDNQSRPDERSYDLDALIREELPKGKQYKTARIITLICEATDGYFSANEVSERLKLLGKSGIIEIFGNMDLWAYSEVRYIERD